jgi:hypothetical protein
MRAIRRATHPVKQNARNADTNIAPGTFKAVGTTIIRLLDEINPRKMLMDGIEQKRAAIQSDHAKNSGAIPADKVALLNELYVKIKVPLLVKYGTCGWLNESLKPILEGLESGNQHAQSIINASWDGRMLSGIRKSPLDPISIEMDKDLSQVVFDSLGPGGLFDLAVSDFNSTEKYRTCEFGLPSLNAGLEMIKRYNGLPH